LTETNSLIWTT